MGVNICKKIIIQKNFNKKSIIPYSYRFKMPSFGTIVAQQP